MEKVLFTRHRRSYYPSVWCWSPVSSLGTVKKGERSERWQKKAEKQEEQLKAPGTFSMGKRKLRVDVTAVHKYLKTRCKDTGEKLFSLATEGSMQGDGFHPQHSRWRSKLRRDFQIAGRGRLWHRLPREAGVSSLEVFKQRLGRHLSGMG